MNQHNAMTKYAIYSQSNGFYSESNGFYSWQSQLAHALKFNSYDYAKHEMELIAGGKDHDMSILPISWVIT